MPCISIVFEKGGGSVCHLLAAQARLSGRLRRLQEGFARSTHGAIEA